MKYDMLVVGFLEISNLPFEINFKNQEHWGFTSIY